MPSEMQKLVVQIVAFIRDAQPGWVACEFTDAQGRRHRLEDKAPIFTAEAVDAASVYPRPGIARCEVLARWNDSEGRNLVRITTARPDGIESAEAFSEFVVLLTQLSSD